MQLSAFLSQWHFENPIVVQSSAVEVEKKLEVVYIMLLRTNSPQCSCLTTKVVSLSLQLQPWRSLHVPDRRHTQVRKD